MSRPAVLGIVIAFSAASLALLFVDAIPLGVPGEWTWGRLDYTPAGWLYGTTLLLLGGTAYGVIVHWGDRHIAAAGSLAVAGWLGLLVAAGFGWLWGIQSAAIDHFGLGKAPNVLYYRRTEGYYWQARYDVASVPEFLAGYESLMAEQDYLHIGTHPPGLTLLYCGLLELCQRYPAVVNVALRTQPAEVVETLAQMERHAPALGAEFTRIDAAALWLAALATQFAAAFSVVPLYCGLRLTSAPQLAWRAVAFWPLVPAVAIFLPKSDLLYPLIGVSAAWLWRSAWFRCRERLSVVAIIQALLAGLMLCVGLTLSLAFLTVVVLIGVQHLCDILSDQQADRTTAARVMHEVTVATLLSGCTLIALGGVLSAFGYYELNLLNVWSWNLSNHALFYDHNFRTWWKWLLVNPLELTLAVGVPIITLVKCGAWRLFRDPQRLLASSVVPISVVFTLLWLSGKNMGEAARLWILLMPWLAAAAASALDLAPAHATMERDVAATRSRRFWLALLCLQIIVSGLTTLRVDGFHFTELTTP